MRATEQRLQAARQAGHMAADADVAIVTELLYGPIFHRWLLRTAPLSETYVDQLLEHVLRAVQPR